MPIAPPRAVRVKTAAGWVDLAVQGPPGAQGAAGAQGPAGATGAAGAQGPAGPGVPVGGTLGQALIKKSASDYDTQWAAAGADLRYDGDYAAATNYTDGDIVIYQGVAYLCVRPTNAPPVAWPGPLSAPGYGTVLPGAPVDGQEFVLVDSVTNPTYQWRFRYNAGSTSPYKWEFVGGSPKTHLVNTNESSAVLNQWKDLPTDGPLCSVPRNGEYLVSGGAEGCIGASQTTIYIGLAIYTNMFTQVGSSGLAGMRYAQTILPYFVTALAGDVFKLRYYSPQATDNWTYRKLTVQPVRVA